MNLPEGVNVIRSSDRYLRTSSRHASKVQSYVFETPGVDQLGRRTIWEVCASERAKLRLSREIENTLLPRMRLGRSLALPTRKIHKLADASTVSHQTGGRFGFPGLDPPGNTRVVEV